MIASDIRNWEREHPDMATPHPAHSNFSSQNRRRRPSYNLSIGGDEGTQKSEGAKTGSLSKPQAQHSEQRTAHQKAPWDHHSMSRQSTSSSFTFSESEPGPLPAVAPQRVKVSKRQASKSLSPRDSRPSYTQGHDDFARVPDEMRFRNSISRHPTIKASESTSTIVHPHSVGGCHATYNATSPSANYLNDRHSHAPASRSPTYSHGFAGTDFSPSSQSQQGTPTLHNYLQPGQATPGVYFNPPLLTESHRPKIYYVVEDGFSVSCWEPRTLFEAQVIEMGFSNMGYQRGYDWIWRHPATTYPAMKEYMTPPQATMCSPQNNLAGQYRPVINSAGYQPDPSWSNHFTPSPPSNPRVLSFTSSNPSNMDGFSSSPSQSSNRVDSLTGHGYYMGP